MNTATLPETTALATAAQTTEAIAVKVWNLRVEGPDLRRLLALVADDLETARDIVVDSPFMAEMATEIAGRFLTVHDAVEAERLARGKPLRDVLVELQKAYVPTIDQLAAVADLLKVKLAEWNRLEAARIRKEQEEAAEQRRIDAKKAADAEAAALAQAQQLVDDAAAARAQGSEQVAAALETQASVAVDTARQQSAIASASLFTGSSFAKPKGSRETWKAECTDKAKLLRHIGERIADGDLSLIGLVEVDQKAINALAKIQKENLSIPGVRPVRDESVAIRRVELNHA